MWPEDQYRAQNRHAIVFVNLIGLFDDALRGRGWITSNDGWLV